MPISINENNLPQDHRIHRLSGGLSILEFFNNALGIENVTQDFAGGVLPTCQFINIDLSQYVNIDYSDGGEFTTTRGVLLGNNQQRTDAQGLNLSINENSIVATGTVQNTINLTGVLAGSSPAVAFQMIYQSPTQGTQTIEIFPGIGQMACDLSSLVSDNLVDIQKKYQQIKSDFDSGSLNIESSNEELDRLRNLLQ